jgi:hypothetical protein
MACISLARRRSAPDVRLLVLFGALALAFMATIRVKQPHYAILIAPAAFLLVGAYLEKLSHEPWLGSLRTDIRTVAVLGMVGAALTFTLLPALSPPKDDYEAVLQRVRQAIPAASSVIGSQTYWFGLPDERYLSWDQLAFYRLSNPSSTLEDAFRDLNPGYIIMDRRTETSLTDDRFNLMESGNSSFVAKAQMIDFLQRYTHLVAAIPTETFGDIRIYKIDWN